MIPAPPARPTSSQTSVDAALAEISMSFLCFRCREETELFFERKEHDPRYCYELFRRAITQRDELAWHCLYHRYEHLAAGWVERNPLFAAVEDEALLLVNRAFEKMWQSLTPEKFDHFPDLKSLLRYLQMCAHSVLVDLARATRRRRRMEDIEPSEKEEDRRLLSAQVPGLEEQVFSNAEAAELWRLLHARVKNDKERLVVHGLFVMGLRPAQLLHDCPQVFQDVREIYLVKDNLVGRLRRDAEFKRLYENL